MPADAPEVPDLPSARSTAPARRSEGGAVPRGVPVARDERIFLNAWCTIRPEMNRGEYLSRLPHFKKEASEPAEVFFF